MNERFPWDDDYEDTLSIGRWEGRCRSVLKGKPWQRIMAELERALLLLPHKRLISGTLCDGTGVCSQGAMAYRRLVDSGVTPRDAWKQVKRANHRKYDVVDATLAYATKHPWGCVAYATKHLGMTETASVLVAQHNDGTLGRLWNSSITPEERYTGMLRWARQQLRKA